MWGERAWGNGSASGVRARYGLAQGWGGGRARAERTVNM